MNQAARNATTQLHTRRLRCRFDSVFSGPTVLRPADAAALDVPTAGVPTYLFASVPRAAAGFGESPGFTSFSGPAMFSSSYPCLLYTSDAADERSSVDLGGR